MLRESAYVERVEAAKRALAEARAAGDTSAFVAAQARVEHYDALLWMLREARVFDERLHPRDRLGRFVEVLRMLTSTPRGRKRRRDADEFRATFDARVAQAKREAATKLAHYSDADLRAASTLHARRASDFRKEYREHDRRSIDPRFRPGRHDPVPS